MDCPFCRKRPVTRVLRLDCIRKKNGEYVVLKRCDACAGEIVSLAMLRGDKIDNRGIRDDYDGLLSEEERHG